MGKTPQANSLPTTVSRSAGLALTKAMSKDLGQYNIRVNAVCIGLIRSDQIEKRWQNKSSRLLHDSLYTWLMNLTFESLLLSALSIDRATKQQSLK